MPVYLDYNATTPVSPEVQRIITGVLENEWGNPSSSYSIGKSAKETIEKARFQVAGMINAKSEEIVFTSGGTESNNLVFHSILQDFRLQKSASNGVCKGNSRTHVPHIITTNIEHDAVRLPLEHLAREGRACISFVPVSKETGAVLVEDVLAEIRPTTRLVSVMLANNETGVIQPVQQIKDLISLRHPNQNIFFHTDAAQAIGKIPVDVQELEVDYLTIVGHKFYAPRIGALYFREKCPLHPMFYGGGQERGYRPGTENTCMIAGLGLASELVTQHLKKWSRHMNEMKTYLEDSLQRELGNNIILNKRHSPSLPNTLSVVFNYDNITGEMLLDKADGVFASTGAACHSSGGASAVLIASGVDEMMASKTIRLSVGRDTSKADIDKAVLVFKNALLSLTRK